MKETHVDDLMTSPMLTLSRDTPVKKAVGGMIEANINSLVVVGEGCQPAGIFTSTDVMKAVDSDDSLDAVTVEQFMTSPVETLAPDDSLAAAADRMRADDIGHLPVTDEDGDGVGILSKTDLVDALAGSA